MKDLKIFVKNPGDKLLEQINETVSSPAFEGQKIRIMPDSHSGIGICIGFTSTFGDFVNPEHIGCLDSETEVLTESGWIKINEWEGQEILEFDPKTNKSVFRTPKGYIKKPCNKFYYFYNKKSGLNIKVSEEHKLLVYFGNVGHYITVTPPELVKMNLTHAHYRYKAVFDLEKESGIDLSDPLIRIDAMVQADGYVEYRKSLDLNYVNVHLKRKRKCDRIEKLLKEANVNYKVRFGKDSSRYYIFHIRKDINKDFSKYYRANKHQLRVLRDECLYWDGHIGYRCFYVTKSKREADVIQYAFAATGIRCSIISRLGVKENHSRTYHVILTKNSEVGYSKDYKIVNSLDGYKYCFITEAGFFICRRGHSIFTTGNCDIGCSVSLLELSGKISEEYYPELERKIRKIIPLGKGEINEEVEYDERDLTRFLTSEYNKIQSAFPDMVNHINVIDSKWISEFCKRIGLGEREFYKSIGSIGSSNHFIEYGESDDGIGYISFHTGSRSLGSKVCTRWSNIGKKASQKDKLKKLIKEIKDSEPDRRKWGDAIENASSWVKKNIPVSYLCEENAKGYFSDMVIAQAYASFNHLEIGRRIEALLSRYNIKVVSRIKSTHNYIDFEDMIIRKGAIRAHKDELCIIPFNMRDGFGIFRGLGNADWNYSAPHGSGRKLSRTKAFEDLEMSEFKEEMKNVYSTSIIDTVLDESPMAYKDTNEILEAISGVTVELIKIVKPKISIKDYGICYRK